jgi:hypothetical protein
MMPAKHVYSNRVETNNLQFFTPIFGGGRKYARYTQSKKRSGISCATQDMFLEYYGSYVYEQICTT